MLLLLFFINLQILIDEVNRIWHTIIYTNVKPFLRSSPNWKNNLSVLSL